MSQHIKICICDDHKMMVEGIKLMVSDMADIEIIGIAYNGEELIQCLTKNLVDIVLLDINMPKMDGMEAAKIINSKFPQVKLIFLTMIQQVELIHVLMEHGARAYLLKNSGAEELYNAITKVYQGGVYFDDKLFNNNTLTTRKYILPKLTGREKEVLSLIVKEYTSEEIGKKLFIGTGTVLTHRRNLISKLGVKNTAGLVRMALEYGLV